ncbi:MAG: hypothetical protein U1E50_12870 [Caulobacteraceae bacterium]
MCLAAGRIIHTIEAFEITEAHDTPRYDLSLFGSHPSKRSIPWPDRARNSHANVQRIGADAAACPNKVSSAVWLVRERGGRWGNRELINLPRDFSDVFVG